MKTIEDRAMDLAVELYEKRFTVSWDELAVVVLMEEIEKILKDFTATEPNQKKKTWNDFSMKAIFPEQYLDIQEEEEHHEPD